MFQGAHRPRRALSRPSAGPAAISRPWPKLAAHLPALGPVLLLYRDGGFPGPLAPDAPWPGCLPLHGLLSASRVRAEVGLDSEGLRERLSFMHHDDRTLARLCLLPDSDYLAWETALSALRAGRRALTPEMGPRTAPAWHAAIVGFRLLARASLPVLDVQAAPGLSACGREHVQRLLRAETAQLI